jgi:hypothetical protein
MLVPSPSKWTPVEARAEFGRWLQYEHFRLAMLGADGNAPSDFDDNGQPIPLQDWNTEHELSYLKRCAHAGANLALRTRDFPVVDIDCPNPHTADAVEAAIAAELGVAPSALSGCWCEGAAKRGILFALKPGAAPFMGMSVSAVDANGEKQVVRIIADGELAVVAGMDAATGARLQFREHPTDAGPEWMVEIDESSARRVLGAAARNLCERFWANGARRDGEVAYGGRQVR